jgi:hypothetical protein
MNDLPNETETNKHGGVYIYEHPDVKKFIYKIGKSNDIVSRHSNLSTAYYTPITNAIYIYPVIDKIYTSGYLIFLERQLHKYFHDMRINPNREFFKIKQLMAKLEEFKNYMSNMGILINITLELGDLKRVHDIILGMQNEQVQIEQEQEQVMQVEPVEQAKYYAPYDYQIEIIERMYDVLNTSKRGILELATGIGKTCLVGFYLKKYNMCSVLVLCPQILICESFKNTLSKCGVDSVIINSENQGEFMNNSITITTYQTYLLNIETINNLNYDLIIYDEAHHLLAESFRKSLDAVSDKKLFMTATKKTYKKLKELVDLESESESESEGESDGESESASMNAADEQFDMNDLIFGETIYKITIEEGILKGLLCDYKIFLGNWELGLYNLVMQLKENYLRKKIIMYFNTIKNSKQICEELKEDFKAYHIDGSMSRREKQEILENFKKDEFSILCNVNVIAEGVDIPAIDTIIFMESRYSEINTVQIIGRSVRVCQGKDFSMVICKPEMFNAGEFIVNLSRQDSRISNKNMFLLPVDSLKYELDNVVKLVEVSKFGDRFDWWIEKCLMFEEIGGEIKRNSMIKNVNIGWWITNSIRQKYKKGTILKEQKEKLLKIKCFKKWLECGGDKIIAKNSLSFEVKYNMCIEYQKEKKITQSTIYQNVNLGVWLFNLKNKFKKNKLSEEKKEKLIKINYWKEWLNSSRLSFDEKIKVMMEYQDKNIIYSTTGFYKHFKIGSFINDRKIEYKRNKLSDYKKKELLKINHWKKWITSYNHKKEKKNFKEHVELIKDFELHNNITQRTIYKNVKIGIWMNDQIKKFKQNKLTEDQLTQLNQITYWKEWLKTLT